VVVSRTPTKDYGLEAAAGRIPNVTTVNKYGESIDVDATGFSDLWEGTGGLKIWVPPTTARIHNVVSSSASDTLAGTGAQRVTVYGLTSWDTPEVSEVVNLNGVVAVPTVNAYVIIHRLWITQWGSAGPSVGIVSAIAQVDLTYTASMYANVGSTVMAIYGIPSVRTLYLNDIYASLNKAAAATVGINVELVVNPIPKTQLLGYRLAHATALIAGGTSQTRRVFDPPMRIDGPAIVKLRANATANNQIVTGGFNGVLEVL